ncbi:hypothetical protein K445DRAFT_26609 [Daldinia sp. EC12]|nr:hypothetical protein K445DRAFT_26609 [Daldinia sp. EC12]
MATPARLEEGYGIGSNHGETRESQQDPGAVSQQEIHPGSNGTRQAPLEIKFRSDLDVKKEAPSGWPYIAAAQLYYPNFNIHRRFSYLLHRALIDQETKLAYLEAKLKALDKEDEHHNASRLTSLPFDPETLLSDPLPSQPDFIRPAPTTSRADNTQQTYHTHKQMLNNYRDNEYGLEDELLQLDKEMQKLPAISRKQHKGFFEEVEQHNKLDGPAYEFLLSQDDFVTTVIDQVHQYFERFLYGSGPVISFVKKTFGRTNQTNNQDTPSEIEISNGLLKLLIQILVIFGSGVLLLSPVAILFLVTLSRGLSFMVVVIFIFAFVAVLSCFNSKWDTILVGLSAYMAVLATFLSNLEQGKTQIS